MNESVAGTDQSEDTVFPEFIAFEFIYFDFEAASSQVFFVLPLGLNTLFEHVKIAV